MKNVMIDIETLGLMPGSAVTSIALVDFDLFTGEVHRQSHWYVSQGDLNDLVIELGTLNWWMDHDLKSELRPPEAKIKSLVGSLVHISRWIDHSTWVWCKGLHFDIPVLKWLYQKKGLKIPWNYRNLRDSRSIVDLAKSTPWMYDEPNPQKNMRPHNALNDALYQVQCLSGAVRALAERRVIQSYEPGKS